MSLRKVILGFLDEPAAGYDIKTSIDRSLSHIWAAETSQIYGTLRAMEKEGLLTSTVEKSDRGPDRRVYQRTRKGEQELTDWLDAEPEVSRERLSLLCQIHFVGRARNPKRATALLQRARERFVERLAEYEALRVQEEKGKAGKIAALFDNLALDLGVRTLEARIEWCDEAIRQLAAVSKRRNSRA